MLTRLHVQGFKSLFDLDVQFGPFTCIAGPNAAGKSNLFDAIRFLHLLTQHPIMEAVKLLRETKGRSPEPRSLFTSIGNFRVPRIQFTAEMLVRREVADDFGVVAKASISSLRYSVAFRLSEEDEVEKLELAEESLVPITVEEARRGIRSWASPTFRASAVSGRRPQNLISTTDTQIKLHQEGHGGRNVPAPKSSWTVLGGTKSSDFPTVLAANREMASWRTLLLEPSAMRAPSFYSDERRIDARGANLPGAIERLRRSEKRPGEILSRITNRLSELIDDVQELRIRDDEKTETLTLEVRGKDGVFHPARSLSDGTLRFLVLAALEADFAAEGLLCLEEPENGIHPERIPAMVRLLKDIAVDPSETIGPDNPLRQVLVNTHSPKVLAQARASDFLYLDQETVPMSGSWGHVTSSRVPPRSWRRTALELGKATILAPGQLQPYQEQLSLSFLDESRPSE